MFRTTILITYFKVNEISEIVRVPNNYPIKWESSIYSLVRWMMYRCANKLRESLNVRRKRILHSEESSEWKGIKFTANPTWWSSTIRVIPRIVRRMLSKVWLKTSLKHRLFVFLCCSSSIERIYPPLRTSLLSYRRGPPRSLEGQEVGYPRQFRDSEVSFARKGLPHPTEARSGYL